MFDSKTANTEIRKRNEGPVERIREVSAGAISVVVAVRFDRADCGACGKRSSENEGVEDDSPLIACA